MKTATRHLLEFLLVIALAVSLCFAWWHWSRPVLRLYIWNDYIYPDVIADFENEFNVRVEVKNYRSNEEMLARVKVSWNEFDVIMPSNHLVRGMRRQGLLARLSGSVLENRSRIDPRYFDGPKQAAQAVKDAKAAKAAAAKAAKGQKASLLQAAMEPGANSEAPQESAVDLGRDEDYALPYLWNCLGIGYSKTEFPGTKTDDKPLPPQTWRDFFSNEVGSKFGQRRMLTAEKRELVGLALIASGKSPNSIDRAEIREAGRLLKPQVLADKPRLVWDDGGQQLQNGSGVLLQTWAPEITRLIADVPAGVAGDRSWVAKNWQRAENWVSRLFVSAEQEAILHPEIGYKLPEDGSIITIDTLAIPASSGNQVLAQEFINFLLRKEIAKRVTRDSFYGNTLLAGVDESLKNTPSYMVPAKTNYLVDVDDAQLYYDGVWAEFTRIMNDSNR